MKYITIKIKKKENQKYISGYYTNNNKWALSTTETKCFNCETGIFNFHVYLSLFCISGTCSLRFVTPKAHIFKCEINYYGWSFANENEWYFFKNILILLLINDFLRSI